MDNRSYRRDDARADGAYRPAARRDETDPTDLRDSGCRGRGADRSCLRYAPGADATCLGDCLRDRIRRIRHRLCATVGTAARVTRRPFWALEYGSTRHYRRCC